MERELVELPLGWFHLEQVSCGAVIERPKGPWLSRPKEGNSVKVQSPVKRKCESFVQFDALELCTGLSQNRRRGGCRKYPYFLTFV